MESLKADVNGVDYVPVPEVVESSCEGCVAYAIGDGDKLCDAITGQISSSCNYREIIWAKKADVQKQVEQKAFFGNKPITYQILEHTDEEEEAWQTAQKKIATGVTDGPAERAKQLPLFPEIEPEADALSVQVDGSHYKSLKIQPVEYIHANNIGYCEANVIKYISRWRDKGGKKDLEKVKHYVDLLIQLEGL